LKPFLKFLALFKIRLTLHGFLRKKLKDLLPDQNGILARKKKDKHNANSLPPENSDQVLF
jgi:hypothetical protein